MSIAITQVSRGGSNRGHQSTQGSHPQCHPSTLYSVSPETRATEQTTRRAEPEDKVLP